LFSFLEAKVGIEYKSIAKHLFIVKNQEKVLIENIRPFNHHFSAREPPWLKGEVIRKCSSKIGI